jgi:hypothetical protein
MRICAWIAAVGVVLTAIGGASGAEAGPFPIDPEIQKMVSTISIERVQRSIFVLVSSKTRHTFSDPSAQGDGIGGAAAWIRAEFERTAKATGGRLQVSLDTFEQPPQLPLVPHSVEVTNIVATLPGSTGRTYVVCAHYDSRARDVMDAQSPSPGADDNAAGVAALLELARALGRYDFNATLVFIATDGGEQGGLGAAQWAEQARQRGADIAGVIDFDAIGRTQSADGRRDRDSVRLFAEGAPAGGGLTAAALARIAAGGENDSPSRALARAIVDAAARYVPALNVRPVYRADRLRGDGDHAPFLARGFPAVRVVEGVEDARPADDGSNGIDFDYVTNVARVNGAALASLACAPAAPSAVSVASALPGGDPVVRWAPPSPGVVAGYRVLWRDTASLAWQHALDVPGNATDAAVPGARPDETLFGVEAFDAAGHVSPAAFALPGR